MGAVVRFRYTLLNEAWRLVESGVLSVSDIDAVMSEGLGMRYAFLGMCSTLARCTLHTAVCSIRLIDIM